MNVCMGFKEVIDFTFIFTYLFASEMVKKKELSSTRKIIEAQNF